MDLNFFADPGLAPKPRSEIRIEEFRLSPYPDGRRVRVEIELTPFAPADRPSLEITAHKPDGTQAAATTIIESVQRSFGLTMHLRTPETSGEFTFQAELYYGENPPQDTVTQTIQLILGGSNEEES